MPRPKDTGIHPSHPAASHLHKLVPRIPHTGAAVVGNAIDVRLTSGPARGWCHGVGQCDAQGQEGGGDGPLQGGVPNNVEPELLGQRRYCGLPGLKIRHAQLDGNNHEEGHSDTLQDPHEADASQVKVELGRRPLFNPASLYDDTHHKELDDTGENSEEQLHPGDSRPHPDRDSHTHARDEEEKRHHVIRQVNAIPGRVINGRIGIPTHVHDQHYRHGQPPHHVQSDQALGHGLGRRRRVLCRSGEHLGGCCIGWHGGSREPGWELN
mmetsp:Transcript_52528/g.119626  ORF Transcript_52528/g.119626 Transcript_52528/m.119626 type:complete len:267 (-) Transcript_52528:16-816(-)